MPKKLDCFKDLRREGDSDDDRRERALQDVLSLLSSYRELHDGKDDVEDIVAQQAVVCLQALKNCLSNLQKLGCAEEQEQAILHALNTCSLKLEGVSEILYRSSSQRRRMVKATDTAIAFLEIVIYGKHLN